MKIGKLFEPPSFGGDEKKSRRARLANTLILYLCAAILVSIVIIIPLFAVQKPGSWIVAITVLCVLIVGRGLIFRGYVLSGSLLIFSTLYFCVLALLVLSGGSSGMAMFFFATVVLVAGYFLDARV